jgi:hypothetical protein
VVAIWVVAILSGRTTGDEVMSRMIALRQSRGSAALGLARLLSAGFRFGGVLASSLMAACLVAGCLVAGCLVANPAGAQTKQQDLAPGETYIAPDRNGYQMKLENRKHIVCTARRDVYERLNCDQVCTDRCRDIGASLRDCDLRKTATCTR